ncbi:MAG: cytochrome bc complex cytochrome b subunit [Thaumarchaeota archaeon]|nr:cytochrome bc complex cytochrome b subunit [Nitrososphaerota archaeon]
MGEPENEGRLVRLVHWFDSRLGLSYQLLRPVPQYAINPFYWLGALAVVAFVIQGITGMVMMLYYVPSPTQAYTSTLYIFQNVYFGAFLQTVHLYTAYAMIMLAFMHLMRGYFVSVHKKPRELMWVTGMLMGFVTLGFGFTGYLLPWSVISKSATDVGVGMIQALPPPVSSFVSFLIVGVGGDAATLLRFYDLHVVILPAVLLALLVVKMYMLETHGISEPALGDGPSFRSKKLLPVFPDVSLYLLELAALFGVGMLLISFLFPVTLPPAYTPQLAATIAAQPDWYFLWIYQILKISAFEGGGLPVALTLVTGVLLLLVVLPFIDRSERRRISERPRFIAIGAIFAAELVVLAGWGLLTPGQGIPTLQATLVLGGTALAVGLIVLGVARALRSRVRTPDALAGAAIRTAQLRVGLAMTGIIALGALSIGVSMDSVVQLALNGLKLFPLARLVASLIGLAASAFLSIFLIFRLHSGADLMRRRLIFLRIGWNDAED